MIVKALLLAAVLLAPNAVFSARPDELHSTVRASALAPLSPQQLAQAWGLKPEEWSRYEQLMQGPLGTYSPNLDPLTALGIEAPSAAERQRYAALQIQAEARRVEKLLAYQRAYDAAWTQQFPDVQPVNLAGIASATPQVSLPAGNGRLALFVKANCAPCNAKAQTLQSRGTAFDLYLVGSDQDDAQLRQWARQANLSPLKVRARRITLNHDGGRWQSLGLPGDLPALVREVGGRWQRQ
ncbi:TIGR03759 family integrating conjugative element protein [Pseudomonas fluorescens]|uniref:TIGR03759 family integrating conjugative element protein n=1 Tax=Pseudomonas fluorescens TaxID=294 RepID=UPI001BEA5723|nr:TIGR03759 family integrating conjugative element protein [Pseudomonas fluorescens]MBT2375320.1 TIGR03759 family integrating conjugative element protein [Pseudomonas fluorescens]